MDVGKLLGDLKAEREQIEDAIGKLERLAKCRSRPRGRPPAWRTMVAATPAAKRRGRPLGSKNKVRTPDSDAPTNPDTVGAAGV